MKPKHRKQVNHKHRFLPLAFIALSCLLSFPHVSNAQEGTKLLTLEEAYSLTMKTDERIMIAQKEINKSRLLPKKAWSVMLPNISVEGGYSRLDEAIESEREIGGITVLPPVETVPEEQFRGTFEVSQPVYKARFFPLRQQALQKIDRSTESHYQTIQEILFRTAQVYYEVLKAKGLVQNVQEILKLAEEGLKVSRVRLAAGEVTEDVVLRSELDVTSAQRTLIESKNYLKLAKDTLNRLIGMQLGEYDVVKPATLPPLRETYKTLINKAFEHRHDYRIALLNIQIAEADKQLVKARFHPRMEATWNYNVVDDPAWLEDDDYWVASFQIKLPLFEKSSRIWDLKEKQESLLQTRLALEERKKSIRIEVEDAMLTVQTHESVLKNLIKQVELAQKNYDIIFSQFEFGSATALDLNLALTTLDSAKTDLITKTYDYQGVLLKLEKAIGMFALEFKRAYP
jgi:outer membrane protein TolC